jgi:putative DNA primase/helicase
MTENPIHPSPRLDPEADTFCEVFAPKISWPPAGEPTQPLRPLPLEQFLALEIPPRKMLLGPVLPMQAIAMLYGPRGCGKTHVALGAGLAVATGTAFLRWLAPEPRRVLYIDGEMPAGALQERLAAAKAKVLNPSFADRNFEILAADTYRDGLPDLSTSEGRAAFAPALEGFDLIIADNISTLCRTGKENEAESWGELQGWALTQRRAGRSVLFLHHAGKGGDQRGTSRREDVMDTVMKLSRPQDYTAQEGARFVLEYTKARGFAGVDAESFEAWLRNGEWQVGEATSARDEQIIALKADGLKQREIAAEVGSGVATVNRVLKRAAEA